MLELDFVGKLELYESCFNLDEYYKNKAAYLELIVRTKDRDPFMKELYDYAIAHQITLPANPATKNKAISRNIVKRAFDSLHQRGVRRTLSAVLERLVRRAH